MIDDMTATPYDGHWSFAYTTQDGDRADYDFRVEFAPGVSTREQREVIALLEAAPKLRAALHYLLEQTVDMDLKYGIGLSEGEEEAREQALNAIAMTVPT